MDSHAIQCGHCHCRDFPAACRAAAQFCAAGDHSAGGAGGGSGRHWRAGPLNIYIRQPLDMLTMLGFVILTGVVVNNAILMIEQAMLHMREEAMDAGAAIIEATCNRIRPIFMSTLTSLFGLVPLVIFPGAGSELYRGLGVVVFGGLGLSTIATLIIVPPLLSIALQKPPRHCQCAASH